MSKVHELVISRIMTVYGVPTAPDPDALYREFVLALDGFSDKVLEAGISRVLRTHEYPTWPVLGEIVSACRAVAYELTPRDKPEVAPVLAKEHVGPERVQELISSFAKSLTDRNSFEDIKARCPIGGRIDVSAPWGQEVTDKDGNIVPIRQGRGKAA